MTDKQTSVDLMGDHLSNLVEICIENGDTETAQAIYDEWIVNDNDPEDGSYEFMFINDLTAI